jgi:hypothetical protein
LGVLGVALLFTHFHGLVMLLLGAPVLAWAWRGEQTRLAPYIRALAPLVPAAMGGAAFLLLTWAKAEGTWPYMNPGAAERVSRFPEFLAAGLTDPWPNAGVAAFALLAAGGFALGGAGPRPRRALVALAVILAAQVAMYFVLPLNTSTATYVSARHALLVVLLALPLLPALEGWRAHAMRLAAVLVVVVGLVAVGRHLSCFDAEARDFDGVLAAMQPGRRVLPLIDAKQGACASARTFPYLHFAGYYQATKGGDLSHSLADVWNIPIRYRSDYRRYPLRDEVEWAPWLVTPEDVRHFDYVLLRGGPPRLPARLGLQPVTRTGAWTLYENPSPLPSELPSP